MLFEMGISMMVTNHWEVAQDMKLPQSTTIDLAELTDQSISAIKRALCRYGIALVSFGRVNTENDVILSLISALGQTHTHDGKGREI